MTKVCRRPAAVLVLAALLLAVSVLLTASPALAKELVSLLYLSRAGDPAYIQKRRYTGLSLRERHSPVDGARLALRSSGIKGRALGLTFELEERALAEAEAALDALPDGQPRAVLLDLPYDELRAVVAAAGDREDLILFNIRHPENALRNEDCAPALFHTLPSWAMLGDALAQFLKAQRWTSVLSLTGETEDSKAWAAAFRASARKFGLEIVAERGFELTKDPRRRDRSNIVLMTAEESYDVVFLADEYGEFGRYVPFATHQPRPVVGSEGLTPLAWHWTWERHGAPQLNQRFRKRAKREMSSGDWAAWTAVRALVEAITRTRSTEIPALRAFMTSDDFTLDVYKGAPARFRSWSGQLNQPILLATHNAVIERAPLDGFMHRTNTLDTLGFDKPASTCRLSAANPG